MGGLEQCADPASPIAPPVAAFLDPGLAPSERIAALRALWRDAPALAQPDGLIDYAGDYTGAVAPKGTIATAWQLDRGHLSEAEAAAWALLGAPGSGDVSARSNAAATPEDRDSSSSAERPTAPADDRKKDDDKLT